jgi:hypothetical protein
MRGPYALHASSLVVARHRGTTCILNTILLYGSCLLAQVVPNKDINVYAARQGFTLPATTVSSTPAPALETTLTPVQTTPATTSSAAPATYTGAAVKMDPSWAGKALAIVFGLGGVLSVPRLVHILDVILSREIVAYQRLSELKLLVSVAAEKGGFNILMLLICVANVVI